jgi:hypothetical protein
MRSLLELSRPLLRKLPPRARDALRFVANPRREARYITDWKQFRDDTRSIVDALRRVSLDSRSPVLILSTHEYVP